MDSSMALNSSEPPRTQRSQLFESFRGRLRLGALGSVPQDGAGRSMPQQQPRNPALNRTSTSPTAAHAALVEQEQLQLALALSASEADPPASSTDTHIPSASATPTSPSGRRVRWSRKSLSGSPQREPSPAAPAEPQADISSDEALARDLQRQLDAERWQQPDSRSNGAGSNGSTVPAPRQPRPSAPAAPGSAACSADPAAPGSSAPRPSAPVSPSSVLSPATQLPAPTLGQRAPTAGLGPALLHSLGALGGSEPCGVCGKPVRLWQTHASTGARRYHSWCLTCAHCRQPIQAGPGTRFAVGPDQSLYHEGCHQHAFHPKCSVCTSFLPEQGGVIRFHHHPFWANRFCPAHETDGTPRCTACNRLQLHGEQWVAVDSDRHSCLACLSTMVRNTADCQPLYDDVLSLYASFGMALPTRPPLLLVESAALNEASHSDKGPCGKKDGPVFHTRGLTLSEEHRSIRTVMGSRRDGNRLMSIVPQFSTVADSRWEVTALLVLYGLPWLLTGCILAHEVMHAWLRLSGYQRLSMDVEEGLAQLMALLWLERQQPPTGSYEERLAAYLGKQIREDTTAVYGDGFRAAHEAFQNNGLPKVLEHVRRHGTLPLDRM